MIPLYSDQPLSRFPFVTIGLIVVNCAVFWYQLTGFDSFGASVRVYGMTPEAVFSLSGAPRDVFHSWRTVFTGMFLHGSLLHLLMNMLYLWIFGRNVEDDLGHLHFLFMYLVCGVVATMAFAAAFPDTSVPLVGASGAIAGVLGMYFLLFPTSRIYTLILIVIIVRIIALPAFLVLGIWFLIQIGSGMTSLTAAEGVAGQGGIAWISHVAGFVLGMGWTLVLMRSRYIGRRG